MYETIADFIQLVGGQIGPEATDTPGLLGSKTGRGPGEPFSLGVW